jgi:hypothetical protein
MKLPITLAMLLLSALPSAAFARTFPEVCFVAPPAHEKYRYFENRPCLKTDAQAYIKQIKEALALYPDYIKNALRSVRRIEIESDFTEPAWSAPVPIDSDDPHGVFIGLRKKDLDEKIDLETYLSRSEKQSFGGTEGPEVKITFTKPAKLTPLDFILLHELARTIDYEKNVEKNWVALHHSDVPSLRGICLDHCGNKHLNPSDAKRIYEELFKNAFVSQRASISPVEDWGDSLTYCVMTRDLGADLVIQIGKDSFPTQQLIDSPAFAEKRKVLESLSKK